jgi:hypothetical protein
MDLFCNEKETDAEKRQPINKASSLNILLKVSNKDGQRDLTSV